MKATKAAIMPPETRPTFLWSRSCSGAETVSGWLLAGLLTKHLATAVGHGCLSNTQTAILFHAGSGTSGNYAELYRQGQKQKMEEIMPIFIIWAVPAVIVIGGVGYYVLRTVQ